MKTFTAILAVTSKNPVEYPLPHIASIDRPSIKVDSPKGGSSISDGDVPAVCSGQPHEPRKWVAGGSA